MDNTIAVYPASSYSTLVVTLPPEAKALGRALMEGGESPLASAFRNFCSRVKLVPGIGGGDEWVVILGHYISLQVPHGVSSWETAQLLNWVRGEVELFQALLSIAARSQDGAGTLH